MHPALTPWTAIAAILAFGASGLWTWMLLEGIEVVTDPMSSTMRRVRLAGAASCCAAMVVAACACWNEDSGWTSSMETARSMGATR